MSHPRVFFSALSLLSGALLTAPVQASPASLEALSQQLAEQQQQLDALRLQLQQQSTVAAAGPAAPAVSWGRTALGGYGEAILQRYDNAPAQYDAYRFVLSLGHQFSDTVRLNAELEVEHGWTQGRSCSVTDKNSDGVVNPAELNCPKAPAGEVELEQMLIEWQYRPDHALSAGQMLMPIGLLNETHEPSTFYGARRNPVETVLIPTSWWEGGVKASGQLVNGLAYDAMVSTGLRTSAADIRGGRQKGAKALAEDVAYTGRLRYQQAGWGVGLSLHHQRDISQGDTATDQPATLVAVHGTYENSGLSLKALYGQWRIDGLKGSALQEKASQRGFFVESGYRFDERFNARLGGLPLDRFGVFARYSQWDLAADAQASGQNPDSRISQWNVGTSFFLTPDVVLKADWQTQKLPSAGQVAEAGFAVALGYSF